MLDLYSRGVQTCVASWEAYARGSRGAAVVRRAGVAAAVFPHEPARSFYNNALLERELGPVARAQALDAMEAIYAAAGVERFATWVHESDVALRDDIAERGYTLDTTTLAMGMELSDIRAPAPEIELAPATWAEYLRAAELPAGLLEDVDEEAFHARVARLGGESVATGFAFDLDGDSGIFNVGTHDHARRRGLGTAVTALLVHDAAARGCRTASLQSTAMAERVYAAVGFRDLGRILEYVP